MTTPALNSSIPTRIFEKRDYQIEIETAINLEKFEQSFRQEGHNDETTKPIMQCLKQVACIINLQNPEEVKNWLANLIENKPCTWKDKTKVKFCYAYTDYLTFRGMTWKKPKYTIAQKLPFIPTEQEIDLLISGCGKTTSTVLQTLKETAVRIGELVQIKWTDIDFTGKTVSVTPEKGSNGRILPVSNILLNMIKQLPRIHGEFVFQPQKKMLREYYSVQRKAIAERLQNPRLMKITFHTFRHWKATMLYHETQNIRLVQRFLGHKSITSTEIYENTEEAVFQQIANSDQWTSIITHSPEEEVKCSNIGFTLVRSINETTAIYRKRK
jgi:integrase/recombinase XerD